MTDRILENDLALLIPAGRAPSLNYVTKFGHAPDGGQAAGADIWDRADATPTQSTWVAPSLSGWVHNVASTNGGDTSAGLGAQQVTIYGLTDWDTKEVSEVIEMNGTSNVVTTNSYVIVHRAIVTRYGVLGPNLGTITVTSSIGSTVTAQINIGIGQTNMAIYGIPSVQSAYLTSWYASIQKASGAAADCNFRLLFAQDPVNASSQFVQKEIRGLQSNGTSNGYWPHNPYKKIKGPGILKIRAISSSADLDVTGGFDLILRDN